MLGKNHHAQTEIDSQIATLPVRYQEVLNEIDWSSKALRIGQLNGLTFQQIESFVTETILVLIGLEAPSRYLNSLIKHSRIDAGIAQKLQFEIQNELFYPMEKLLQERLSDEEYLEPEMTSVLSDVGIHIGGEPTIKKAPKESMVNNPTSDALSEVFTTRPAPTPTPNVEKSHDPYHESIE